jgi:hypothetical protein
MCSIVGSTNYDIAIEYQQIPRCDIAVRKKRLNCLFTGADQQRQARSSSSSSTPAITASAGVFFRKKV